jgi:asparagine synthase (glutamine-hydrolysing)
LSAQGGIWHPDGKPIEKSFLDVIRHRLEMQGPDGGADWEEPGFLMAHRAFHTDRNSRLELQPFCSSNGHILTWSGRLDNRLDLLHQLRGPLTEEQSTDVALVMLAWLKWGRECFARLVGDWAMALYDSNDRAVYLARDYVGTRPLFYHTAPNLLLWCSELPAVVELVTKVTGSKPQLNEDYVAGYLAFHPTKDCTPFSGVHPVAPGHCVTLRPSLVRSSRYWNIDGSRTIRYGSDQDYEEHFYVLLREAVRCRLRSDRPVFSQLSGGLDSSTIVCVADEILRGKEAETNDFRTISFIFERASETDEREFSAIIKQKTGRTGYDIREDDHPARFPDPGEISCNYPSVSALLASLEEAQWVRMNGIGGRILLTGECGDELLGNIDVPDAMLADLIWDREVHHLQKQIRLWSAALAVPSYKLFWRGTAHAYRHRLRRATGVGTQLEQWMNPAYVRDMGIKDRAQGLIDPFDLTRPSARDRSESFETATASPSQCWSWPGMPLERTYPFLHRPVVEFLQAIPPSQILRPGERRSLMRRSMRHLLPDRVRNRRTKRNWDGVYCRALMRDWERIRHFFQGQMILAERKCIVHARLLASIQSARHGGDGATHALWKVIYLELWLRAHEQNFNSRESGAILPLARTRPASSSISVP